MQKCMGFESETIDGYTNFVFLTDGGSVITASSVNRAIKLIIKAHNEAEEAKAEEEGREAVMLPDFSAHILRHTFCTRLCENETNLKVIQSIMGHRNIETTLDVYAEATDRKKQEAIENISKLDIF
jgi:integrase